MGEAMTANDSFTGSMPVLVSKSLGSRPGVMSQTCQASMPATCEENADASLSGWWRGWAEVPEKQRKHALELLGDGMHEDTDGQPHVDQLGDKPAETPERTEEG